MKTELPRFVSDSEVQTLALLAMAGKPDGGITSDELSKIVEWAEQVRIDNALLQNILDGLLIPSHNGKEMEFAISPKGIARAKKIEADDARQ